MRVCVCVCVCVAPGARHYRLLSSLSVQTLGVSASFGDKEPGST